MDLRPGARFCDRCGTKVEKICPACGAVLRDQARFCDLCGVPLEGAVPVSRPKAKKGGIAAGQLHTVAHLAVCIRYIINLGVQFIKLILAVGAGTFLHQFSHS